jgi:hypothetical protein
MPKNLTKSDEKAGVSIPRKRLETVETLAGKSSVSIPPTGEYGKWKRMVSESGNGNAFFEQTNATEKRCRKKINSRAKGQRGERQWRDEIRAAGWNAERGVQFAGGPWSPDVRTDLPFHFEVKAVEALNLEAATAQAERDARGEKPWAVAHKRNLGKWRVTMSAETFFALCRKSGLGEGCPL